MPSDVLLLSNRQITFSLLEQGMFLAAVPYNSKCFERNLNDFKRLEVNNKKICWPIYLIWRENTIFSASMLAFIAQIKTLSAVSD
jgi:hypothetical protein